MARVTYTDTTSQSQSHSEGQSQSQSESQSISKKLLDSGLLETILSGLAGGMSDEQLRRKPAGAGKKRGAGGEPAEV